MYVYICETNETFFIWWRQQRNDHNWLATYDNTNDNDSNISTQYRTMCVCVCVMAQLLPRIAHFWWLAWMPYRTTVCDDRSSPADAKIVPSIWILSDSRWLMFACRMRCVYTWSHADWGHHLTLAMAFYFSQRAVILKTRLTTIFDGAQAQTKSNWPFLLLFSSFCCAIERRTFA